jgi:hypothetical protein
VAAPKGTPPEIVDKLNAEINAAFADPRIKARLNSLAKPLKVLGIEVEDRGKHCERSHSQLAGNNAICLGCLRR